MSAEGVREHDITRVSTAFVVVIAVALAAIAGGLAYPLVNGNGTPRTIGGLVVVLVLLAAFVGLVPRRLIRRARIEGGRLHARTLTGEHEIDLDDITELGRTDGMYGLSYGQIRHRGGRLMVMAGPGAELMRDLREARPDLAGKGSRRARH